MVETSDLDDLIEVCKVLGPGRARDRDPRVPGRWPFVKFVVLMAEEDPEAWDRATQEYRDEVFDRHRAFDKAVRERGEMVAGEALALPKEAVTLRPGTGPDRMVTEGPYAEVAEQLGGFYLIDVDSRGDRARPGAAAPRRLHGRGPARHPHRGI